MKKLSKKKRKRIQKVKNKRSLYRRINKQLGSNKICPF